MNALVGRPVEAFVRSAGYSDELLRFEFPIWLGRTIEVVDLAAFANGVRTDMSTATLIGKRVASSDGIGPTLAAARALASPAAVVDTDHHIELWSVGAAGREERVATSSHEGAAALGGRFRDALQPDALFLAKTTGKQLALFPVDVELLSFARRGSADTLARRVDDAVKLAFRPMPDAPAQQAKRLVDASRLVISCLAALMVRDKFGVDAAGIDLLWASAKRFPGYFAWLDELKALADEERLTAILNVLGDDVNYEALDPAVVSEVYERAVVSESERLRLGIFYTPPGLAQFLASAIPFEELPQEERVVLDPACGSGTLLLAAHDRLQGLVPVRWPQDATHKYLVSHLIGFDMDQFAVEVAKLSLLLHALPWGNSWQIEQRDVLNSGVQLAQRPSVIISNPPWRDIRSRGGVRHQVANDFLQWMLMGLGARGFLGVVLPASWLTGKTSRETRELVQQHADIFEILRLPEGTFREASSAPCLMLAQARTPSGRAIVFRRVLSQDSLAQFYDTGLPDEQAVVNPQAALRSGAIVGGPLDAAADLLRELPLLRNRAEVQAPPIPEPPVKTRGGEGPFLWLPRAQFLPPFGEAPEERLRPIRFPEEFHRAGTHDGSIFRRRKILASAKRSPNNPWRLKVGVDHRGVIPRESLYMIIPPDHDDESFYGLVAILGSAVASAWVDTYEAKMAIDAELLRELPIPAEGPVWKALERQGRALTDSARRGQALEATTRETDAVVFAAYGLPELVADKLRRHFAGFAAPEGLRYPAVPRKDGVPGDVSGWSFGAVLGTAGEDLRLWVAGVTPEEGVEAILPKNMPGWLYREGSTFEVEYDDDDLGTARYRFQRRSYQEVPTVGTG